MNIMKYKQANKCECEECVSKRSERIFPRPVIQKEKITFKSHFTSKFEWKIGSVPIKNLTTNALAANISTLVKEIKQVQQNTNAISSKLAGSTADDISYSPSDTMQQISQSDFLQVLPQSKLQQIICLKILFLNLNNKSTNQLRVCWTVLIL